MKKRLLLLASVLLTAFVWAGVQMASSNNSEPLRGVYYGEDICCCFYDFNTDDAKAKAEAKKECDKCNDGKACKYREGKVIAAPACLCRDK